MNGGSTPSEGARTVEENVIVRNFSMFCEKTEERLTGIIDVKGTSLILDDDTGTAVLMFTKHSLVKTVVEKLTERLHVNVLVAMKSDDDKFQTVLAYSRPYEEEMYSVCLRSSNYGLSDSMQLTFYESLDIMLPHLVWELEILKSTGGGVLEEQHAASFYANFI